MTTIAWDGKTLAADCQATSGNLRTLVTKIVQIENGDILAWTGSQEQGLVLMDWYRSGAERNKWPTFQSDKNDWTRLVVFTKHNLYEYEQQPFPQLVETKISAFGSGRELALGAMSHGATAEEAVLTAAKFDTGTGFGVMSFPALRT